MADRYWVGGAGTWDSSNTTNWSDTTGGSGGFSVPSSADNAFFDNNSGTGIVTFSPSIGYLCGSVTYNSSTLTSLELSANITILNTFTLTLGTINLVSFTLRCSNFSSSNSNVRSIQFGTGNIDVQSLNEIFNCSIATNLTCTGTPTVNISTSGTANLATLVTISTHTSGATQSNTFDFNITGLYTFRIGNSSIRSLNFTGFTGAWNLPTFDQVNIYGNLTLSSGMTVTYSVASPANAPILTFRATSGTQIITSAGKSLTTVIINSPGAIVQLNDNTTINSLLSFTLTAGTLNLNNFVLSTGTFNSNNSNTRAIQFGTGNITTTGSGTAWTTSVATGLTYTGTPTVNISNSGATSTTITPHVTGFSESNVFNFNITTGTYTLTITNASRIKSLTFSGFTGTWARVNNATNLYGSLIGTNTITVTSSTSPSINWFHTSGTATCSIIDAGIIDIACAGGILQPLVNLNLTNYLALTSGTLDLGTNNVTLTCIGNISSSNSNVRSIQFGTTGNITVKNTTTSSSLSFPMNGTNFSYTGNPTINIQAVSTTTPQISVYPTNFTDSNALNFNISGSYGNFNLFVQNTTFRNLDFTGFTGTWTISATFSTTFYGDLTIPTGMTFQSTNAGLYTLTTNFASSSRTQYLSMTPGVITVTVNSTSSRLVITNNSSCFNFNHNSGTLAISDNNTFQIASLFNTSNSLVREIEFGTNSKILIQGEFTASNTTNLTITGTSLIQLDFSPIFNLPSSDPGESKTFNLKFTGGSFYNSISGYARSADFSTYTGTWGNTSSVFNIYGDLTLGSGMTINHTGGSVGLIGNGSHTITCNGKSPYAITQTGSGTGSTVTLADHLYVTTEYRLEYGSFNANNKNVNVGYFRSPFSSTNRTITMGSGTWTLTGNGYSIVWELNITGLTLNTDTANIVLLNTTNSASLQFQGSGFTYNNLSFNGGSATSQTYTITGNNTFNTLSSNKTTAWTLRLPQSGTTTVNNWTINGSSGNLVTLNSSSSIGTRATLTKSGGGTITADYISIKDINATPSSTWYATNAVDLGNNLGWTFNSFYVPPSTSGYFLMF